MKFTYVNGTERGDLSQNAADCRKMSQIVVKVVKFVANCRDVFFPSLSRRPLLVFAG